MSYHMLPFSAAVMTVESQHLIRTVSIPFTCTQ